MSYAQFAEIFAMLALQLRATDADEAMAVAYHKALQDLEPEFVAMAAERMGNQGGADGDHPHWFPKTSEWRALAGKIEGERAEAVTKRLREYHKLAHAPVCTACEDSGWERVQDGSEDRWRHCRCRSLRRLEVLGRRPLPQLPERAAGPAT